MPKITELNQTTAVSNSDLLIVVRDIAGLPVTDSITVNNFVNSISTIITSEGAVGYTGSSGANGATGYTGSRGANGTDGYTGSTGAGYTGSQGTEGFTGSQGLIGYTGSQGSMANLGNLVVAGSEIYSTANTGNIVINSNLGDNTYSWTFGDDGSFTIPGNTNVGATAQLYTNGPNNVYIQADAAGLTGVNIDTTTDGQEYVQVYSNADVYIIVNTSGTFAYWTFKGDGNLILPDTGGNIQYSNGLSYSANLKLPAVNNVNIDASNSNVLTLNTNDTVTFSNFSGEILVNDINSGFMYKFLAGSGHVWLIGSTNTNWTPSNSPPANTVSISSYVRLAFTGGNYVFTNLASQREYNFFAIKTSNYS
jgi:Collagen triple helix repeat (20 copies)